MASIEIKEPEHLLVYDKSYSMDFVRSTIQKKGLSGLHIFDQLDPLMNLDFLGDYTFLTHLSITTPGDHDFSFLRELDNLRSLAISSTGTVTREIDLGGQAELTELVLQWRKNIQGLDKCQRLEKLTLVEFKEKDLAVLHGLSGLKHLTIMTGSMKELRGIEERKSLESVFLGNCKGLVSLDGLEHLPCLGIIELDTVTKAKDFERLVDLPALTQLKIVDCKEVPSLGFVRHLPALKRLLLLGNTEIADGDLTPARSLEYVFYKRGSDNGRK